MMDANDSPLASKLCSHCRQLKPLSAFSKNRARHDGYQADCKDCIAAASRRKLAALREDQEAYEALLQRWRDKRQRYHAKPEVNARVLDQMRASRARRRKATPEAFLATRRRLQAERRARRKGAPGRYSNEDMLRLFQEQGGCCAYCARPFAAGYHVEHKTPLSRGGSNWPDNLCLACPRCNSRKKDKTDDEFRAWLGLHLPDD